MAVLPRADLMSTLERALRPSAVFPFPRSPSAGRAVGESANQASPNTIENVGALVHDCENQVSRWRKLDASSTVAERIHSIGRVVAGGGVAVERVHSGGRVRRA